MNTKIIRYTSILFLIATLLGCSSPPDKVTHPISSQFPPDSVIDHSIDLSSSNKGPLPGLYHPDSLQQIGEIGTDSVISDEYYYYNTTPNHIDIDPKKNIYMVQEQSNSIQVYSKEGTFKYSIGGTGRGPGEFLEINTFDFSKDYEKLYVLAFYKVEVFTLENGQYEHDDTIFLKNFRRTYDLCLINNKLFISGFRVDPNQEDSLKELSSHKQRMNALPNIDVSKPISRYNLQTSTIDRDFGYKYESASGFGFFSGMLSETKLICNENTNTVIGFPYYYPYVFGYDLDGNIKWRSKIDNYTSIQSIEKQTKERGPVLQRNSNTTIYNWYYPSREIGNNNYSLLQVGYALPSKDHEKPLPDPPYKTLMIDSNTGKIQLSESYSLIGAQKNDIVITIEDREPETYIYRFNIHEL